MSQSTFVHIVHPEAASIVLRSETDWDRDLVPVRLDNDTTAVFELPSEAHDDKPFLQLKPVLHADGALHWSPGPNKVVLMGCNTPRVLYPYFRSTPLGQISELQSLASRDRQRTLRYRVYVPPGYNENYLKKYPVLYMHDGANLFFAKEAFTGVEWQVDETLDGLSALSLVDQTLVVALYADNRMTDYTEPGFYAYGDFLAKDVLPKVANDYRVLDGPEHTVAVGSSLGGVVAFALSWHQPEVFGAAGCLSSTFGYRDSLIEQVLADPVSRRSRLRLYLDSGWPSDNYEANLSMATALDCRGFVPGSQYLHLVHPFARHSESDWARRLHLPLQFLTGRLNRMDLNP